METSKLSITLPPLHRLQKSIYDDPARFKVMAIGRRWGKSYLARVACLDAAINQGKIVWWLAPTYKTARPQWNRLKQMLKNAPFVASIREMDKEIRFKTGGVIYIHSTDNSETLRGEGLGLAVLDEAAFMPSDVWYSVILPSLIDDPESRAFIISTPNGLGNWFYDVWELGQEKDQTLFKSWRFPSQTSPYVDKTLLKSVKKTTPSSVYKQEYEAEFIGNAGAVFPGVEDAAVMPVNNPQEGKEYVFGIDWGRKNDYTVISVWDREDATQQDIIRFTNTQFSVQIQRVLAQITKWQPKVVAVETNSMGGPLFERLKDAIPASVRLRDVYMTNPRKRELIEGAAVAIEQGSALLLSKVDEKGSVQLREFQAMQMTKTKSGFIQYGAPKGVNDDTVISAVIALDQIVKRVQDGLGAVSNPFL